MKKVYISCYENSDKEFKNHLIKFNQDRNNVLFHLIDSQEKDFNSIKNKDPFEFIDTIKKHILRDSDIVIFLIGLESHKRMTIDWEARAAMHDTNLIKKCGIVVVYLPDVCEKYGTKIPRSVLPKIIQKNMICRDAFILETTWSKLTHDINNIEKVLNVAFAYGQMSNYISDSNVQTKNESNIIIK